MPRRTSLFDASRIEDARDLEDVVQDKRASWRANNAKARRRQRRYKKKLIAELPRIISDNQGTYPEDDT
jgi:ribosomal protein L32